MKLRTYSIEELADYAEAIRADGAEIEDCFVHPLAAPPISAVFIAASDRSKWERLLVRETDKARIAEAMGAAPSLDAAG